MRAMIGLQITVGVICVVTTVAVVPSRQTIECRPLANPKRDPKPCGFVQKWRTLKSLAVSLLMTVIYLWWLLYIQTHVYPKP